MIRHLIRRCSSASLYSSIPRYSLSGSLRCTEVAGTSAPGVAGSCRASSKQGVGVRSVGGDEVEVCEVSRCVRWRVHLYPVWPVVIGHLL